MPILKMKPHSLEVLTLTEEYEDENEAAEDEYDEEAAEDEVEESEETPDEEN